MRCSALCPQNAIEAGQSWGVILYFITVIPVSFFIPVITKTGGGFESVLDILSFYPAIFISYYIFHFLLRIPAINWLFTHTTMTHFSFWGRYHEPDTKLKDMDE